MLERLVALLVVVAGVLLLGALTHDEPAPPLAAQAAGEDREADAPEPTGETAAAEPGADERPPRERGKGA